MTSAKAPLHSLSGEAAAGDLAAARRVLAAASGALTALAEALDGDFTRAVGLVLAAKGRIIVSGMGKSGHVARKIAATLSSTGTPAYFVHPAEASHGDMGAITRQDVLLLSIELRRGAATEPVATALKTAVRDTFGLTPEVAVLETGTLAKEFEASVKTPRFTDRRQ